MRSFLVFCQLHNNLHLVIFLNFLSTYFHIYHNILLYNRHQLIHYYNYLNHHYILYHICLFFDYSIPIPIFLRLLQLYLINLLHIVSRYILCNYLYLYMSFISIINNISKFISTYITLPSSFSFYSICTIFAIT